MNIASNRKTAATAAGREAHAAMDYGPAFDKEFTLPSVLALLARMESDDR